MINISNEAKEKYKSGIIPKEMVVSFPNGEHADIHNDEIVAESLEFQENLVKGEFKFGLCQANYLKFETVADVSECTGAVIDVSIFIDGTEISLGRFTIKTINKSDGLYTIDAYGNSMNDVTEWSDKEIFKRNALVTTRVNYECSYDDLAINQGLYTSDKVTLDDTPPTSTFTETIGSYTAIGTIGRIYVDCIYMSIGLEGAQGEAYSGYFEKGSQYDEAMRQVEPASLTWRPKIFVVTYNKSGSIERFDLNLIPLKNDELFAPYSSGMHIYGSYRLCVPLQIMVRRGGTASRSYELTQNANIKKYIINNYSTEKISIPRDSVQTVRGTTGYSVTEEASEKVVPTILNDYFELKGVLGKASRDGSYQFVTLETATGGTYPSTTIYPSASAFPSVQNAITINMDEYEDFEIKADREEPFGAVFYDYMDETNQKAVGLYQFNEAYNKAYYIKGNSLLTSSPRTVEEINSLLDTYFIPNLKKVMWTKSKIDMTAMPWLESGDPIAVKTNDNTFATYVFNRTLKGIQAGMDEIDSDVSASDTRVAPTN